LHAALPILTVASPGIVVGGDVRDTVGGAFDGGAETGRRLGAAAPTTPASTETGTQGKNTGDDSEPGEIAGLHILRHGCVLLLLLSPVRSEEHTSELQ